MTSHLHGVPASVRKLTPFLVPALVLALAAYLRLTRLDTGWLGGDQSRLLDIALDFVNLGKVPLSANKSSAGVFNPPLIEYLYAIPLYLTHEILSVARFTAILDVLGVAVCYLLVSRFFGKGMGLVAMLLYAINPWAVHFSRMIWNPTPIPFFSALTLYCLTAYFAGQQKSIWLVAAALSLAGVIQLHLAALVLIGAIGVYGVVFRQELRAVPSLLGIALFVATFVPFYRFERAAGFMDVKALLGVNRDVAVFNLSPLLIAGDLASGRGLAGTLFPLDSLLRWATWGALAWMGFTSLRGLRRAWKGDRPATTVARLLLTVWVAVPLLAYLRQTHYLQHHYFLYLYPALFILLAVSIGDLWTAVGRLGGSSASAARAVLAGLLLAVFWSHLRLSLGEPARSEQSLCPQIRHVTQADEHLHGLMAAYHSGDVVILGAGENRTESPLGILGHLLGPTVRLRFVHLGNGLILPPGPTVYLVAGDDSRTVETLMNYGATEADAIHTPCATWRFFVLTSPPSEAGSGGIGEWENGLRLTRFDFVYSPGGDLDLTTRWYVGRTVHHEQYHFFNHLLAPDGSVAAQRDGTGVNSLDWIAGDSLVTWFRIPLPSDLPAGEYGLRIGMYVWPTLERVLLTSGEEQDGLLLTSVSIKSQ